jgi:formate dehydrogenase major subunit
MPAGPPYGLARRGVYNIYRRTKDEMPADRIRDTREAEEEGVIFKNLNKSH